MHSACFQHDWDSICNSSFVCIRGALGMSVHEPALLLVAISLQGRSFETKCNTGFQVCFRGMGGLFPDGMHCYYASLFQPSTCIAWLAAQASVLSGGCLGPKFVLDWEEGLGSPIRSSNLKQCLPVGDANFPFACNLSIGSILSQGVLLTCMLPIVLGIYISSVIAELDVSWNIARCPGLRMIPAASLGTHSQFPIECSIQ